MLTEGLTAAYPGCPDPLWYDAASIGAKKARMKQRTVRRGGDN